MFQQNQRSTQNQNAVTSSAIVAKAVLRQPNGRYEIVIVFQKSTRQEMYWRFQAKTQRSPRRSWKFAGYAERDINCANKPYSDFSSYIDYRVRITKAEVISMRMPQKRLLTSLLKKTERESIYGDWSPVPDQGSVSLNYVRRRAGYGPKGRRSVWSQ